MSIFRKILSCCFLLLITVAVTAQKKSSKVLDLFNPFSKNAQWTTTPSGVPVRLIPLNQKLNVRHNFSVLMNDSTEILVNSKIHEDTILKKAYLLYTDKDLPKTDSNRSRKIYPESTFSITRKGPDIGIVRGYSDGNYWLFRILEGKISLYSMLSDTDQSDSANFVALQIDDGPVEPWNPARIYPYVKKVDKAYILFAEKKYFDAIKKYNKSFK